MKKGAATLVQRLAAPSATPSPPRGHLFWHGQRETPARFCTDILPGAPLCPKGSCRGSLACASRSKTPLRPRNRRDLAGEDHFFLLVDNDARRHHDHQALRFAAVADVFHEAVDVRYLAQDGRTE